MNNFYSVPVSKKFYPLIVVALVVFFILRFSPVLLELFLKFKPGSLPPTGIFTSPTVLGVMILVFLGFAWAIHRNFHILKAFIESNPKRFLTIALVGMICVLAIGKLSFAVYPQASTARSTRRLKAMEGTHRKTSRKLSPPFYAQVMQASSVR